MEAAARTLVEESRRAVLATVGEDGSMHLVPVCFAVVESARGWTLVTPIDEKPKRSTDPRSLARVRDILRRPDVTLLFDRWDEDWSRLAWLRLHGMARLVSPGDAEHSIGLAALRARYPQYRTQRLERLPVIVVEPTRLVGWEASAGAITTP
jgi:PPOX class probable F420-dependent enzyme